MASVTIEYCGVLNYRPRAAGLAASIQEHLGIEPKLIEGSNGDFEIHLDGKPIFWRSLQIRNVTGFGYLWAVLTQRSRAVWVHPKSMSHGIPRKGAKANY